MVRPPIDAADYISASGASVTSITANADDDSVIIVIDAVDDGELSVQLHDKEIKAFEVGINVNPSERASDVVLLSEFESIESLKKYQVHPDHKKLVEHLGHLTAETRVVDYKT